MPAKTAEIEAHNKIMREASSILLSADAFERWGPKDDVEQAKAIFADADAASVRRSEAAAAIEALVQALRASEPEAVAAWADAHVELLDEYLGRIDADTTEAFVANEEREKWARVKAGAIARFDQNGYYVRYSRELYAELFGFAY